MNKLIILFGVLLCLVAVNARHYVDRDESEPSDDQDTTLKRRETPRHRRRRWQSNYGYDFAPPSYYYQDRRDYDRNTQETIQQIYRLLEDISNTLKRTSPPPPPPPQPIYVPYPVPYPMSINCNTQKDPKVTPRFPAMEDMNQNWGIVAPNEDFDDGEDGARPINLGSPFAIPNLMRPAPKVDHGSEQGVRSTIAPKFNFVEEASTSAPSLAAPGTCNAAILSCCGYSGDKAQQRMCFANMGCDTTYAGGKACSSDSIQQALNAFRQTYSPMAQ